MLMCDFTGRIIAFCAKERILFALIAETYHLGFFLVDTSGKTYLLVVLTIFFGALVGFLAH
jgi:hypothetical protein